MNDCYQFIAMNSHVDVAFRAVPKNIKDGTTYLNMWRVENFNLVSWQKKGKFHKGDSYLILWMKADRGPIVRHIHFWLGSETTQDEAGTAAIKAVELDDYLDGMAVQFREVEGYESKIFLSYFPTIMYEAGGYSTGFMSIKQTYEDKLWHVKGKRNIRLNQLPMGWNSMNSNDVFILDIAECMFIWVGKKANPFEKIKAARIAQDLNGQRVSKVQVVVVADGEEKELLKDEMQLFNKYLPIGMKNLARPDPIPDDIVNQNFEKTLKLYVCCDEEGTLKVTELKNGPLFHTDLCSKDAYIIISQDHIWIWVGRQASKQERREAMNNAVGFAKKKNADLCQIIRVVENAETEDFKFLFHNWPEPTFTGKNNTKNRVGRTVQTSYDAKSLHVNKKLAAELKIVDDSRGEVEIFRLLNFNLIPVGKDQFGQFFNSDCYVILYTYQIDGDNKYIIYYWLGIESSPEEQRTTALKVMEMDDNLGHKAMQVRVIQGKEPPHLMTIFKGKMIILMGSHANWEKKNNILVSGPGRHYMLHVNGTSDYNTKAIQVPMRAASLNSNDVFVIFDGHRSFIWAGKGSTGDEREMAKNISDGATFIPEDHEKDDFWNCLGGLEPYTTEKQSQINNCEHRPRLFCLSNAMESCKMDEIHNFQQKDLIPDDIMMLDTWDSLFLWIGKDSSHEEKKQATGAVLEYLENDPSCRPTDVPIYRVHQDHEPSIFTGFFTDWVEKLWDDSIQFEEVAKELKLSNMNIPLHESDSAKFSGQTFKQAPKYGYVRLAGKSPDMLPTGVDAANKERHLTEKEFMSLFQMTYADFFKLPNWKKADMKKNLGLF